MDQDQLNPYVAYEGYVVRVPHHSLRVMRDSHSASMSMETSLLRVIAAVSNEGATQNSTDSLSKEKLTREE